MRNRVSSPAESPNDVLPRVVENDAEHKLHQSTIYKTIRTMLLNSFRYRNPIIFSILFIISYYLVRVIILRDKKQNFAPRYVRYLIEDNTIMLQHLDLNMELYPSKRQTPGSTEAAELRQKHLTDSHSYDHGLADEFETKDCKAQYSWQHSSFPTCNSLFETDFSEQMFQSRKNRLVAHGYWRDVWTMRNPGNNTATGRDRIVFKTMRYMHDYQDRNYDRHRRDAVAMERLTKSKMVINIYGFCGNSGIFEFADGGSLSDAIWPKKSKKNAKVLTATERLESAAQAIMGLASMHNMEVEGKPAIAHTDITPSQFVATDDNIYRLNDFNRARFLRQHADGSLCGYHVGRNPGKNRSPEEYNYEEQSEMVDLYSFGNILYMLLTNMWPFEDDSDEEARKKVKRGDRPAIPREIWETTDPSLKTLKEAMFLCHEQDPKKRATAREVETFLVDSLLKQNPDALRQWGIEEEYQRVDRSRYRKGSSIR